MSSSLETRSMASTKKFARTATNANAGGWAEDQNRPSAGRCDWAKKVPAVGGCRTLDKTRRRGRRRDPPPGFGAVVDDPNQSHVDPARRRGLTARREMSPIRRAPKTPHQTFSRPLTFPFALMPGEIDHRLPLAITKSNAHRVRFRRIGQRPRPNFYTAPRPALTSRAVESPPPLGSTLFPQSHNLGQRARQQEVARRRG